MTSNMSVFLSGVGRLQGTVQYEPPSSTAQLLPCRSVLMHDGCSHSSAGRTSNHFCQGRSVLSSYLASTCRIREMVPAAAVQQ
jgi:hypothetical protein